jgi:hypothetical protein
VGFVDRVAEQALKVRLARVLLSVIAFPFYVVGLFVGVLLISASFMVAAARLGIADMRRQAEGNDGDRGAD